jgi:hypothetical protein
MKTKFLLFEALLFAALLTSCSSMATRENGSIIPVRLYGNGQLTIASMAWNASGRGEIWFSLKDGENFRGEYSTIAPEVYGTDLSVLLGNVGGIRYGSTRSGFSMVSSNLQYGMVSAVGDRGTTFVCKYQNTVSVWWWGFTAVGSCLDSKRRFYSAHASSSDTNVPADIQQASASTPDQPSGPVMTMGRSTGGTADIDCNDPIVRTEFPALCPAPPRQLNVTRTEAFELGAPLNPQRESLSEPAITKKKTAASSSSTTGRELNQESPWRRSLLMRDQPPVKVGFCIRGTEESLTDNGRLKRPVTPQALS